LHGAIDRGVCTPTFLFSPSILLLCSFCSVNLL